MIYRINSNFLYLLPLLYFFGPLFLEIGFFVFLILNLKFIKLSKFVDEIKKFISLLFLFLFISIFAFFYEHDISLIKGVSYLRFFIYFIILNILIPWNTETILKFSKSALFISSLLVFYNLYQVATGFQLDDGRTTIPFRYEPITGSLLNFFSPFVISYICWNFSNKNYSLAKSLALISIIAVGCIISGERIVTIFFISSFLIFCFLKSKKVLISYSLLFIFISAIAFVNSSSLFKKHNISNKKLELRVEYLIERYQTFYKLLTIKGIENSIWGHHYYTAIKIWDKNKLIGTGIKSFREECKSYTAEKKHACSTHPHNLYLEILSEIGLIGLGLFILSIALLLFKALRNLKNIPKNRFENFLQIYLIIYLLIYLFPYKTSGSFFNNFNSFIFWFIIFVINYIQKLELNNEKK